MTIQSGLRCFPKSVMFFVPFSIRIISNLQSVEKVSFHYLNITHLYIRFVISHTHTYLNDWNLLWGCVRNWYINFCIFCHLFFIFLFLFLFSFLIDLVLFMQDLRRRQQYSDSGLSLLWFWHKSSTIVISYINKYREDNRHKMEYIL